MAVMNKPRTHYDNLQVAETASPEVIRRAYKVLSQRWHPDKNPQQRDKAERVCVMLNEAYAVLSDPVRRAKHDRWITLQREAAEKQAEHQRQAALELARVAKRYGKVSQSASTMPERARATNPAHFIRMLKTASAAVPQATRKRQLLTLIFGLGVLLLLYAWPGPDVSPSPPDEPMVRQPEPLPEVPQPSAAQPQPSMLDPFPTVIDLPEPPAPALIAGRYRVRGAVEDIIEDTHTGLYWMRCSVGQEWDGQTCSGNPRLYTWEQARQLAAVTPAKRLPSIEELRSLVYCSSGYPAVFNSGQNVACSGRYQRPTVVSEAFPNTPAAAFWASDFAGDSERAWFTFFYSGHSSTGAKTSHFRVRLLYSDKVAKD